MRMITTEVLVVGGGTGGTAAAIQAARRGAKTVLVSEFPWLGGMLTSAGVPAPDGHELAAFQTGLWGAFLRELRQRQPEGLDHAWVSFFTYDPRVGAQIFRDWAAALPNLQWIVDSAPHAVLREGDRVVGVEFEGLTVRSQITLDGTELGDLLALGEIPHRWSWEWRSQWQEPSAPEEPISLSDLYPVQAPTWVTILQDFGEGAIAPEIPAPPNYSAHVFDGTWDYWGPEKFLDYGRLPGDRFMLNWPFRGNDYGVSLDRLIESSAARSQFYQEARWYTQGFAHYLQSQLGRRYGLAEIFPALPNSLGGGGYALHPYFRESRRLQGLATVREQDILPLPEGQVAPLPRDGSGRSTAIALGNYANDHHYPGYDLRLQPKSIRWGGRWTGTPFALPYGCLVPATVDGLLVCEKNISVSHIANGATRLQPAVLSLGQAAGMAAALCVQTGCQPRDLPVASLQDALLTDPVAPVAIAPLFNLLPDHPEWLRWQRHYLEDPDTYPATGYAPIAESKPPETQRAIATPTTGQFQRLNAQEYQLHTEEQSWQLVTLWADLDRQLAEYPDQQPVTVWGHQNPAGPWIVVKALGSPVA